MRWATSALHFGQTNRNVTRNWWVVREHAGRNAVSAAPGAVAEIAIHEAGLGGFRV